MGVFAVGWLASFAFYATAQRNVRADWRRRMLLFPIFMAGAMGLAVNNTRAVVEAIIGRRSEFKRTPKYNIRSKDDSWRGSSYHNSRLSIDAVVELALAAYFLAGAMMSLYFADLSALPFQIMLFVGFALVGGLSVRHARAGQGAG